jgi:hypothetical protein
MDSFFWLSMIYQVKPQFFQDYFTDSFTCSVNSFAGLKPGTE